MLQSDRDRKNLSGRGSVHQGCVWSEKCPSGKCPSGKCPSGKCPLGKCLVGEMSIGEVSVGEVSVGEVSVGEVSVGDVSVGEMSVGELSGHPFCPHSPPPIREQPRKSPSWIGLIPSFIENTLLYPWSIYEVNYHWECTSSALYPSPKKRQQLKTFKIPT